MAWAAGVLVLLLLFACAEHIVMGDVRTTTVSLGGDTLVYDDGKKGVSLVDVCYTIFLYFFLFLEM
jgi:hypothetical protein